MAVDKNILHGITELLGAFLRRRREDEEALTTTSVEALKKGSAAWIDAQDPTDSMLKELGREYGLQPMHIGKSLKVPHIARVEQEESYIFLLLHLPHLDGDNRIAIQQIMAFLSKDYLVTVHDISSPTVRQAFEAYKSDGSRSDSSAKMLLYLIDKVLDDIGVLARSISIELDLIEESVFDNDASDAMQISQIRRKIMRLRRTLSAQKSVLEELDALIDKFTGESLERYYTVHTNRSIKLWESLEEARETIEIYKDADFTSSQERNNQILAILTIVFTLGIPMTLIGTVYGMNIPLPGGLEAGAWGFWGEYTTLIVMMSISVLVAIGMWLYFKSKRWF